MSINRKAFAKKLIKWWSNNKRDFPWRYTRDPYKILASEVMLHRTRAEQVVPVYKEFLERFPTIDKLCRASLDDVKKVLRSLGLHWRTELLHKMAEEILMKYGGKIPSEKGELESLPGVSQYIASTVRCFAFGYPAVLLDTNTVRILGRVFGVEVTDGSRRSKQFRELYQSLIDEEHSREFNFGMIDLGALVCKPRSPSCDICPVHRMCAFGRLTSPCW